MELILNSYMDYEINTVHILVYMGYGINTRIHIGSMESVLESIFVYGI